MTQFWNLARREVTLLILKREREIWSILTPITRVNTRSAQAKTLYKIDELVSIWVSFKPELSILESCGPRCLAV
jgi:hypothetical protein